MLTDDNQSLAKICTDPNSYVELEIKFDDAERNTFIKAMLLGRLLSKINISSNQESVDKIMNRFGDVYNKLLSEIIYRKIKVNYSYDHKQVIIKLNNEMSSYNRYPINNYIDNMIGDNPSLSNSSNSGFKFVPYLEKNKIIRSLFDDKIYKSHSEKYDKNIQSGELLILDHFIFVKQYLKNISIINKSSYTKIPIPIPENNDDNNKKIFDPLSETKKYVRELLLYNRSIFDRCIADKFHKIMGEKIDTYPKNGLLDIRLKNGNDLSNGQLELFYFITELSRDKNILLIDEPCVHLAPQNKEIFRKEILEKQICNQLIMITHTPIFVSEELGNNIIQFYSDNGITKYNNLEQKIKNNGNIEYNKNLKLIFEHRDALFAKKCLLVEGYHDKRVLEQFLKVIKNNDYFVIDAKGKKSKLWQILDKLNISYKIIYDVDKLYNKKNNKLDNNFDLKQIKDLLSNYNHGCDNDLFLVQYLEQNNIENPDDFKSKYIKFIEDDSKISLDCDLQHYIEKQKYYLEKFNDYKKKRENIKNETYNRTKHNPFSKQNLNKINNIICKNYESLIKSHIVTFDFDIEKMFNLLNNRILIWNKEIKDIEGFGDKIFNDEKHFGETFLDPNECRPGVAYKEKWYEYTDNDIFKNIKKNIKGSTFQILQKFLESDIKPRINIDDCIFKFIWNN